MVSADETVFSIAFSALTLLVGHQEEHLAHKKGVMRCWCGYMVGNCCLSLCLNIAGLRSWKNASGVLEKS